MRPILLCFFILMLGCASQEQSTQGIIDTNDKPIINYQVDVIEYEIEVGKLLYRKDKMAADATDLIFQKGILPNDKRIHGWVTDTYEGVPAVIFMGKTEDGFKSFHAVLFSGNGLKYLPNPDTTKRHQSMFHARMLALSNITFACSDRYNTIVIESDDTWVVYLIAATTEPNKIMAGGHHKITISKTSEAVIENKPLSKSCLQLQVKPNAWPMMTHIVDPNPIATHSFLSLLHNIKIFIGTDSGVWKAENGNLIKIK